MTRAQLNTWQDVQSEVLNRIHSRRWKPGDLIPNEADLATEFGCARATVNRALRAVAEAGLLDRKRKAGTRVATHPVRKATLNIPIIRQEIEQRNHAYSYSLISSETVNPPIDVRIRMKLDKSADALHTIALHQANGQPYVSEDRWTNIATVPELQDVDLSIVNANEWLVANASFTRGDISFCAVQADKETAELLGAALNDALFVIDRTTWNKQTAVTSVRLTFHPQYRMQTTI
ncbi:MAG: GntR family transcriptional regulator [Rhizobiaceae bacterium]